MEQWSDARANQPQGRRHRTFWIVSACILAVLVAVSVVLLAGLRWLDTMPVGTGEERRSPDGRFTASVMDYTERHFLTGKPRRWFEFRVTGPGVAHKLTSTPFPGPYFGSRSSTRVIAWEPDSSAVRFVFPSAELRFETGAAK